MIASHYAEPLPRILKADAAFRAEPSGESESLGKLTEGAEMRILDISRGWAWGYGPDGRVGYVAADAISG